MRLKRTTRHWLSWLLLAVAILLTAWVYWPGLSGGYVFDDFPNIVDNAGIHVTHSTLANWANAMWASPASDLQRPLASLTFAANWFFSGSNPGPMKAVNLAIHLLNGVLLYFMLRELLRAWNVCPAPGDKRKQDPSFRTPQSGDPESALVTRESRFRVRPFGPPRNDDVGSCGGEGFKRIDEAAAKRLALIVAAGWLLLPINLMAVLYVVQRMESLCQVFVLAGLWVYLRGRLKMLTAVDARGERIGIVHATLGLLLGTGLGLLSKESAVLLPVYAFLIECTLLGFASKTALRDRRIGGLYVFVLFLPAILGLAWLLPHVLNPAAWDGRSFTLGERLLTEARVLVKYLRWTVLPDPFSLSLYHDEMPLSTGWFTPWTTLPAILFLAALLGVGIWLRNRRPLIALGILWFFAGQLLTATIVPLELVYEHRNYFASIGVLLVVFSLLLGMRRAIALPIVRGAVAALLLLWFAGVTHLRAQDWSNPLRLAMAEANRHPDSPRANYEAGRLLIIASDYEPSPALEKAKFYLQRAGRIPGSSTLPEQAQIMIATHEAKADDTAVWNEMTTKLRSQPTTEEDISGLISLTQCRVKEDCHFDTGLLQRAFSAALSRPNSIARLYAAYADFASDLLHNDALAIDAMRNAVHKAPSEPAYRVQLAHWLAIHGMTQDAVREIDALRRMDSLGRLDSQIAILEQQAEQGGAPLTH